MKYKIIAAAIAIVCGAVAPVVMPQVAMAATDALEESCKVSPDAPICKTKGGAPLFGTNSFWTNLINTMIYVIGAISALMIVIGGLRYTISGGDAGQTKSAKDTIIYAIVGVIIAIMSYAILNFVVVRLVQ